MCCIDFLCSVDKGLKCDYFKTKTMKKYYSQILMIFNKLTMKVINIKTRVNSKNKKAEEINKTVSFIT